VTEFAQKYGPWAVVAGASEGIGASLADQLASGDLNLVLIARNGPLLDEVATRAGEEHGVATRAVVQDLTDPDVTARMADATAGLDVGLVIYNAGASDRTTAFLDNEFEYSLKQIKLDCSARPPWPATSDLPCASVAEVASCWWRRLPALRARRPSPCIPR